MNACYFVNCGLKYANTYFNFNENQKQLFLLFRFLSKLFVKIIQHKHAILLLSKTNCRSFLLSISWLFSLLRPSNTTEHLHHTVAVANYYRLPQKSQTTLLSTQIHWWPSLNTNALTVHCTDGLQYLCNLLYFIASECP